ncbi:MAG: NFACT RNA binding domain-containing protein, partial [Cyclobacteriaceae bacterium]
DILLLPSNTCISFPENFKRSKKNNIDLFTELIGKKVDSVHLLSFERAFYLRFDSGQALLFKMHGSRSNILFFQNPGKYPDTVFRKELSDDLNIEINDLDNPLDLSERKFLELEGNASKFLPTLGKLPRAWLKEKGYLNADLSEKYILIKSVLALVESPLFSVIKDADKYFLTLLPVDTPLETTTDPIHAANLYYRHAVVTSAFEGLKTKTLKALSNQKQKTLNYIEKTREKLNSMENETPPNQVADLIMANLHQIPKGVENVVLFDFYRNENREIYLKRGITPQKQAEILYRKSKNRKIEVEKLLTNLAQKEGLLGEIEFQYEEIQNIDDFKTLTKTIKSENISYGKKENLPQPPFKKFEFEGFDILVGKSAKDNDELLRRYSWKDDLWLHAKDVSGSHVIIKQSSGL